MMLLLLLPDYFSNWLFSIGIYLIGVGVLFSFFFRKMTNTMWYQKKMKLRASLLFAVSLLPVLLIITFREFFEGFASATHAQDLSVSIYVKIEKQIHFYLSLGIASLITFIIWIILIKSLEKK